jgi:hypothetical protein
MYEVDEDGVPVGGSKKSAKSKETRPSVSHKSRSDDKRISKSDSHQYEMSGARQDEVLTEKDLKLQRRKSSASSTKSPTKGHTRPPSAHGNRYPKVSIPRENPSNYGIQANTTRASPVVNQYPTYNISQPIPVRPRAVTAITYPTRPVSYHAAYTGAGYNTGPPLSSSAFWQQPIMPAPSYPPPSPSSYMHYAATPQQDYFSQSNPVIRPLAQRFGNSDPIQRTSSAYGVRDPPPIHRQIQDAYEDGYTSASEGKRSSIRVPSRRNSLTRRPTESKYDQSMPPPPRPGILRNRTTEYHPDTSTSSDPDPLYREARSTYRDSSKTRRAPSSHRNSVSYDLPEVRVETANTSHRRQSYYGQSAATSPASGWEEKANAAQSYQEDVSGPTVPLTAEALRRRHAGSSRSTKSSGSRDESDYRKSATTRTTRSGSGNDDGEFTIKVKGGQARVMVGGAQIDCTEGGEIEIKRQKSIRNGSERSGSEYGGTRMDERRSRVDRDPRRDRKSSVASGQSYIRSSPQYPTASWV